MSLEATAGHGWERKRITLFVLSVALAFSILAILPVASLRTFVVDDQKITVTKSTSSREQVSALGEESWHSLGLAERVNLGHSEETVWSRFSVPPSYASQPIVVFFDDAIVHLVELHVPLRRGGYALRRWGLLLPRAERDGGTNKPIFVLEADEIDPMRPLYLMVRSPTPFALEPYVVPLKDWHGAIQPQESLSYGILGFVLMAALLALISGAAQRDAQHTLLGIYCLCAFLLFSFMNGVFNATPLTDSPYLAPRLIHFFGAAMLLAFLAMTRLALGINRTSTPRLAIGFWLFVSLISVNTISTAISLNSFGEKCANVLGAAASLYCLTAGLVLVRKNSKAQYFVISQAAFVFGILAAMLSFNGYLPNSVLTKNLINVGALVSVCLLTVAFKDELFRLNEALRERKSALEAEVRHREQLQIDLELRSLEVAQISYMASLGELAAGIAHEVRNPLASISLYSQLLNEAEMKEASAGEPHPVLAIKIAIDRNVERIIRILDALKRLSARDEARLAGNVSINSVAESVAALAFEKCNTAQVELRLLGLEETHMALVNETDATQIVMNLVNNAYDAVAALDERWIEIRLSSNEKNVSIAVVDSGRGIPPKVAERIMRPFFTTKSSGRGTGLGLSLSKRFAEANGGSLALAPESEHTEFILNLPRA